MVTTGSSTGVATSVLQLNPAVAANAVTVTPLVVKSEGVGGGLLNVNNNNNTMESSVGSVQSSAVSRSTAVSPGGRASDNRRSNKPIMEKRRRARINNCLNELKTLILDAMKKDPARHSKLEKADILEMTVKHLQNLQRQQQTPASDPSSINKFRAGFTECATEVGRFPGLEPLVKRKLLQHLATSLTQSCKSQEVPQVQVHILPNPQRSLEQQVPQLPPSGIILSNGSGTGVQLVPTRLPNGDIALVLPSPGQNHQAAPSQVPLLVPIVPERSASSISAGSSSSYSPSHSPEPMETMYCPSQQKPLSLVVRKDEQCEEHGEERPWRPW
ncbi:protein hairy-like [Anthonomus grandis grandis]|uniref:protein hairy-like n=1 Tax=Anthonomus grandis grandis TaxID=2921223 RepID=UPI002166AE62|nr:protein hairy-like [Anthonomus grandis grandis]